MGNNDGTLPGERSGTISGVSLSLVEALGKSNEMEYCSAISTTIKLYHIRQKRQTSHVARVLKANRSRAQVKLLRPPLTAGGRAETVD
jgi:hypothetical protein